MKKSLVITLALVFVLGIAGTAFAANPFVDVPAKHWAYDAVSKLAKAGVVDGYNDGTFRGDKTMTRYEMAQIVAKAMAKSEKADAETKALVDKLAVEFSAELDNLGVRVTKLEKKMGPVQWSGDFRVRYSDATEGKNSKTDDRLRFFTTAEINGGAQFDGAFIVKRHNEFGSTDKDDNKIAKAAVTFKDFYGTTMTLGRQAVKLGQTGYFMDTWGMVDGAKVQFGNKVKVTAGFADFALATKLQTNGSVGMPTATYPYIWYPDDESGDVISEAYFANVDYKTSKATTVSAYTIKETSGGEGLGQNGKNNYDVWGVAFSSKLSPNWAIAADYVQNSAYAADDRTGYVARVFYKGANKAVAHSWGVTAEYDNWEQGSYVNWGDYANASWLPINGNKFIGLTAQYAPMKNIVISAMQTMDVKNALTDKSQLKYTKVQCDFSF